MSVYASWFGGSHDQLKLAAESSGNPNLRRFFEGFLPEVRGRDAALFHLSDLLELRDKPTSFTTRTYTAIRIDILPFFGEAYDLLRQEAQEFFRLSAETLVAAQPGASVAWTEGASSRVGGRDVHEATFRVDLPKGGRYYEVFRLVLVKEGTVHVFMLRVDSTRLKVRRDELRSMMRTLRYAE